jgi:hypothetical protein
MWSRQFLFMFLFLLIQRRGFGGARRVVEGGVGFAGRWFLRVRKWERREKWGLSGF